MVASSTGPDGKMVSESGSFAMKGFLVVVIMIIVSMIICAIAYIVKNKIMTLLLSTLAGGVLMLLFSIWSGMYLRGVVTGVIFGFLIGGIIIIVEVIFESKAAKNKA